MIRYNTKEFSGLKFFSSFGKWAEEHGSLWSFSWANFWEWGCWRIRTFGFVFPKNGQHSFKCLCPDPVLQALRWLCTSVLSYTIKAECLTQCLVAAPHSQQRERTCCRQLQSVLLLSTHFTGKKGHKYPWAVLILPCNLKCWVSKQVAGTVLGLLKTLRALNNVRFLYEQKKKKGWGIRSCSSSSLNIPSAAVKENQSRAQQIGPRRISTISLCCSSFAVPNRKRKERKGKRLADFLLYEGHGLEEWVPVPSWEPCRVENPDRTVVQETQQEEWLPTPLFWAAEHSPGMWQRVSSLEQACFKLH